MSTNINFHGVTRVGLSEVRHHTNSSSGRSFWVCSIVITCDDGTTQEIGLYSDVENALDPAEPTKPVALDDEPGACAGCSGTGEGRHDGSSCEWCKGSGDAK